MILNFFKWFNENVFKFILISGILTVLFVSDFSQQEKIRDLQNRIETLERIVIKPIPVIKPVLVPGQKNKDLKYGK